MAILDKFNVVLISKAGTAEEHVHNLQALAVSDTFTTALMLLDDDEGVQRQDPMSIDKGGGWYDTDNHRLDSIEAYEDFPLTVLGARFIHIFVSFSFHFCLLLQVVLVFVIELVSIQVETVE